MYFFVYIKKICIPTYMLLNYNHIGQKIHLPLVGTRWFVCTYTDVLADVSRDNRALTAAS